MEIPTVSLENLVNKMVKILSGENPSLVDIGLKTDMQPGKILQGEIIKFLPKKKVAVSIAGQKMVLELPDANQKKEDNSFKIKRNYSFKPGQKIYAKVEKNTPLPVLKLILPP